MSAPAFLWLMHIALAAGLHPVREPQQAVGPHFSVMTYNVNWGLPRPDLAIKAIRDADADIICLQETNAQWERILHKALRAQYPHMQFRMSRCGGAGGLAFLSKRQGRLVAYMRSDTNWFDGWVMSFPTAVGEVEILNVHLQPPVDEWGRFNIKGVFFTSDRRLREIRHFHRAFGEDKLRLVAGDFNETDRGRPLRWLESQGLRNALPQFDRSSPTWGWQWGILPLRARYDHILYDPRLKAFSARVLRQGGSDHVPVVAVLGRAGE